MFSVLSKTVVTGPWEKFSTDASTRVSSEGLQRNAASWFTTRRSLVLRQARGNPCSGGRKALQQPWRSMKTVVSGVCCCCSSFCLRIRRSAQMWSLSVASDTLHICAKDSGGHAGFVAIAAGKKIVSCMQSTCLTAVHGSMGFLCCFTASPPRVVQSGYLARRRRTSGGSSSRFAPPVAT